MKKGSFCLATFIRIVYMWLIGFSFLYFSLVADSAADGCPLQVNPQRVVVKYGGPVSVDCSTSIQHTGMGWEASEGAVPMSTDSLVVTWRVSELTEWDITPYCFINHNMDQCTVTLPVTIYKTPDSVSISTVNHNGPMMEGNQYELQCDVLNVAPAQNLTVNWYKGQTLVNQSIFTDTIKTPVNKTSKLLIRPDRADDGAQYWCEAELELGEEGPRPPPTAPSEKLNVEVYYKPKHSSSTETININDELTLNCTVKANPAPTYSWHSEHLRDQLLSASVLHAQFRKLHVHRHKLSGKRQQSVHTRIYRHNHIMGYYFICRGCGCGSGVNHLLCDIQTQGFLEYCHLMDLKTGPSSQGDCEKLDYYGLFF